MIQRVLDLIEHSGVTAAKLTSDLGLANSSVTDWKRGKSKPGVETIIKLADYFGVSTDYLLGRAEQKNESNLWLITNMRENKKMSDNNKVITLEMVKKMENKLNDPSFKSKIKKIKEASNELELTEIEKQKVTMLELVAFYDDFISAEDGYKKLKENPIKIANISDLNDDKLQYLSEEEIKLLGLFRILDDAGKSRIITSCYDQQERMNIAKANTGTEN